jgi:hypothetical protein
MGSPQPRTFPGTTPDIININNEIQSIFGGSNVTPDMINDWNPPTHTPDIVNTCANFNNQAGNTNADCLRSLINNCQISTTNQNNVINQNNCNALLSYTRTFVNTWMDRAQAIVNRELNDRAPLEWEWGRGCYPWCSVVRCNTNPPIRNGPPDTDCVTFAATGQGCSAGFGAISRSRVRNCELMRNNRDLRTRLALVAQNLRNLSCTAAQITPAPPIVCCNNTLNCNFGDCINIIQLCKQTTNGETQISNATQCLQSRCPMNEQRCIAGTPGAGIFNWICQNNQWTRQPQPPPQPPPPPPPKTTPPLPPTTPLPPATPLPPLTTPLPPPTTSPLPPPPSSTDPTPPKTPIPIQSPTSITPTQSPTSITPVQRPTSTTPTQSPTSTTPTQRPRFTPPTQENTSINYTFFVVAFIVLILLFASSYFFIM